MRTALLPALLLFAGCGGLGVGDESSCKQTYAVPAKTPLGVKAAVQFCNELFYDKRPRPKRFYQCALPAVSNAGSDIGVQLAVAECQKD